MNSGMTDLLLMLLVLGCLLALVFMWIRNRRLKKQVKKIKQGKIPLSLRDKILIALRLKKKPKQPHGGFKTGDVNIRVW